MRRYTLDVNGTDFTVDVQELDADLFEVTVADQIYQVSLGGDVAVAGAAAPAPAAAPRPAPAPAAPRPAAAPAPAAAAPAAAPKKAPKGGGGANVQTAPMPGVIISVTVKVGDKVTRGQQIAILDAMKMHNSVGATKDGTVAEIYVSEGQSVNHGDAIIKFAEG